MKDTLDDSKQELPVEIMKTVSEEEFNELKKMSFEDVDIWKINNLSTKETYFYYQAWDSVGHYNS